MYSVMEEKFIESDSTPFTMAAAWTFQSNLFQIAQGTNANQRIGNKIYVKKIEFCFTMTPLSGLPLGGCMARTVVYHNKLCNGELPTATTLFSADSISAFKNWVNNPKFTIMKDMMHSMVRTSDNAGAVSGAGPGMLAKFSIYPKQVIDYDNNATLITDLLKHDYGIGYICSDATACQMRLRTRVIFTDA